MVLLATSQNLSTKVFDMCIDNSRIATLLFMFCIWFSFDYCFGLKVRSVNRLWILINCPQLWAHFPLTVDSWKSDIDWNNKLNWLPLVLKISKIWYTAKNSGLLVWRNFCRTVGDYHFTQWLVLSFDLSFHSSNFLPQNISAALI